MDNVIEQFSLGLERITVVIPSSKQKILNTKINNLVKQKSSFESFEKFIYGIGGFIK